MMSRNSTRMMFPEIWVIVPAAGLGQRFGSKIPKQYATIRGRAILYRTIDRLAGLSSVRTILVGLHPDDIWWDHTELGSGSAIQTFLGGQTRMQTVFNGLKQVVEKAHPDAWVLVHDAARPLVKVQDIKRLLALAGTDTNGGILACRSLDTLKIASQAGRVERTEDRNTLWQALTPQLFPARTLLAAVAAALRAGIPCTDEAQAMENSGFQPRLIESGRDNLKITTPSDLVLAEALFEQQESQ